MKKLDLSKDQSQVHAVLNHYPQDGFVELVTQNSDPGNIDLIIELILNTQVQTAYICLPNCDEEKLLHLVDGMGDRLSYCVFTVSDPVRNTLQSRGGDIDFTLASSLFMASQEAHRLILSRQPIEEFDEEYVHHSENDDTDQRIKNGEYVESENSGMPV